MARTTPTRNSSPRSFIPLAQPTLGGLNGDALVMPGSSDGSDEKPALLELVQGCLPLRELLAEMLRNRRVRSMRLLVTARCHHLSHLHLGPRSGQPEWESI
jgi:hypothetical protein